MLCFIFSQLFCGAVSSLQCDNNVGSTIYNCNRYLLSSKSWLGSIACSMKINMNQYLSLWPLQNSNGNKNASRIFCALEVSSWPTACKYWEIVLPNISEECKLGWKSAAQLYRHWEWALWQWEELSLLLLTENSSKEVIQMLHKLTFFRIIALFWAAVVV